MRRAVIVTAIQYFGIIFAFAFAMGVARVLVIAPGVGAEAAVLTEVPIVLMASWILARRLLRHQTLGLPARLMVGGIAFTLLMAGEALLASVMLGQSLGQWAAAVGTPLGLMGLAGQLGFAVMPALAGRDPASGRVSR